MRRIARKAGIKQIQIHAFRRAFALSLLRDEIDVFTIQKLMGHSDLQVLLRYLKQNDEDIRKAHQMSSPADKI